MANEAFSWFDAAVFGRLLPKPTQNDLDAIEKSAQQDSTPERTKFIYEMMNALDSKTAALLTHISLIIAALAFYYNGRTLNAVMKFVVFVEIVAYLLLTIFCLRAIQMTSRLSDPIDSELGHALSEELVKRRTVYNWASNATVFVTAILILTLIASALCASN